MSESTHNMGSPTKFKDGFVHLAYIACSEGGFTDEKIAKLFSVAKSTINLWKKAHPDFYDALRRGKDEYDCDNVEVSFLKRAKGFRFTETHRELREVLTTAAPVFEEGTSIAIAQQPPPIKSFEMVVVKKISKYSPPDAKACLEWLCNRNPDRWRKLKHVEVTGKDGSNLMGAEPISAFMAMLEKLAGPEYVEKFKADLAKYDASNKQS